MVRSSRSTAWLAWLLATVAIAFPVLFTAIVGYILATRNASLRASFGRDDSTARSMLAAAEITTLHVAFVLGCLGGLLLAAVAVHRRGALGGLPLGAVLLTGTPFLIGLVFLIAG